MNRYIPLVLILSLVGTVLWLASRPDSAPQRMPEIAGFAIDAVQSIEITHADSPPVKLQRIEGGWQVLSRSGQWRGAGSDAVSYLVDDLAAMAPLRVVTRNPEQYEKLKVGEGATKVTLKDQQGGLLFEVLIGKQGSDLLSTYLRLPDRPEVLAVNRSLVWQVSRPLDGWNANEGDPVDADNTGKSHE